MNRITRCPSCSTVYQLEDVHLQAAKGWLRCGSCDHVFDSTGLVLRWTPERIDLDMISGSPDPLNSEPALRQSDLMAHASDRFARDDLLLKAVPGTHHQVQAAQAELAAFEQALSSFKPEPWVAESTSAAAGVPLRVAPSTRLGSYVVVFLGFFLVLQFCFVQRHAISAKWPESAKLIGQLCESFGCQIGPLRDAEGVVIDSSSLVQSSEGHRLNWSVRNTTSHVLGMTALELSLLDGQGKLVLRRVLFSDQTGAPLLLKPGQSWSGALKLMVSSELGFSDYRLLSFYP